MSFVSAAEPGVRSTLLRAPWDTLDDAALLAHLRAPRSVRLDLVVDEDECTPERLAGVMQGRFEFVGQSHELGRRPDWLHSPSADVEWHILLHKFYYAAGLARAFRRSGDAAWAQRFAELAEGWMDVVPAGFIAADVTGRRVQNWIYALRGFVFHDEHDGPAPAAPFEPRFVRRLLQSLHEQVEHLCAHLTPKRNHRTLELYAIFLAGVALPELERAAHWRRFALEHTAANLSDDLLADGVHCELSTDYHHLALRNWLHVRTLAVRHGEPLPEGFDERLEQALEFSLHVHKPDGIVPALSDGDARSFLPLLAQGAELFGREDFRWVATRGAAGRPPARRVVSFPASGYSVVRSGWGEGGRRFGDEQHLVLDCGPLGEGNHGHLDCLSFELAAFGRSLIVDPGRYTYSEAGATNWRVHFRGTAAHNTVCVDGLQQTRYAPKPIKEPSRHAPGSVRHKIGGPAPEATLLECAAASSGFALLHGRARSHEYDALHERLIVCLGSGVWIVHDRLRAPTPHTYALHFQLHPAAQGCSTLTLDHSLSTLSSPGLLLLQPQEPALPGSDAALVEGWVSERYGHKLPAPKLRTTRMGHDVDFDTLLLPWAAQAPAVHLQRLAVPGAGAAAAWLLQHDLGGAPQHELWFHAGSPAAGPWTIGRFELHGRWLHLCLNDDGTARRATAHAGARLQQDGRPLPLVEASDERRA